MKAKALDVDFTKFRRLAIVAMFADDELVRRLVLKGGNALSLVHGIGARTSLDLDFSLAGDFDDLVETEARLGRALTDRFEAAGYRVFDVRFEPKPRETRSRSPTWGGYLLGFKIDSAEIPVRLDLGRRQAEAVVVGPGQQRVFRIEFSKYEFCEEKVETELDGYVIYVYPPVLIAVEKLRAICQQMPEYPLIPPHQKRARARDFYDIFSILAAERIGLRGQWGLAENVFAAKEVPLALLRRIPETREFHRPDWPAVVDSVSEPLEAFDFYFDAVVAAARDLEADREE